MFSLDEFINVKHINFSNFDVTANKNSYKIQELESIKGNINKLSVMGIYRGLFRSRYAHKRQSIRG